MTTFACVLKKHQLFNEKRNILIYSICCVNGVDMQGKKQFLGLEI